MIPTISVIIPSHKDHDLAINLAYSLTEFENNPSQIVIVNSNLKPDESVISQKINHTDIHELNSKKGRALQMNHGLSFLEKNTSQNSYFLFLHADSKLVKEQWNIWMNELASQKPPIGAFSFKLDIQGFFPWWYTQLVQLRCSIFRLPYGDQGFFINQKHLDLHGKFLEIPLMEDVEWIKRNQKKTPIFLSKAKLTTSPRRFKQRGWLNSAFRNWYLLYKYFNGENMETITASYYK
jgi:hypothetical protein